MAAFKNEADLTLALRARGRSGPGALVGVEGFCGSGKSCLAKRLAQLGVGRSLDTDSYLPALSSEEADSYTDRLKASDLKADIQGAQDETGVVLSGVCLRQVLQRLGIEADVFICVKRLVGPHYWADGTDLHSADCQQELARQRKHIWVRVRVG
jgi:hypothetical protein